MQLAPTTEPEQEKRELIRAWITWLLGQQPGNGDTSRTLFIVEDLHWCDDISLELLLLLSRATVAQPLALLLTYRSDEISPPLARLLAQLTRERLSHELTLAPLPSEAVAMMMRAIFSQSHPISRELVDTIYTLTDGNPFFVEEVLASLVASGDIFTANGRWDRKQLRDLRVPQTIQLAVTQRVDRLTANARRVLDVASVIGQRFDVEVAQAVTALHDAEMIASLRELVGAQLIVEATADECTFRHALTREAVYSTLLKRERKPLHCKIGETLEERHTTSLSQQAGQLAYHFFHASVWDKATIYATMAGDRARSLDAPREALQHYTIATLARAETGQPASLDLLYAKARMEHILGEWDAARQTYELVLRGARTAKDVRTEWQCLLDLGFLWTARDYRQSREHLTRALDVARAMSDPIALAQSLNRVGNWEANAQQPERSRHYHLEALAIFRDAHDRAGEAQTYDLLGTEAYILGDVPFAAQSYAQAITRFRELDDRGGLASALAMSSIQGGSYALDTTICVLTPLHDCQAAGEEAIRLARAIGAHPLVAYAEMILSLALGPRGELGGALAYAHEALVIATETSHHANIASAHWALGAIYHDMLDFVQAQSHLEQALVMTHGRGTEFILGHVSACLARVHIGAAIGNPRAQIELATAADVLDALHNNTTPMQTVWQRALWTARAELALACNQAATALNIIERLLQTAGQGSVPRLWYLFGVALIELTRYEGAEKALRDARIAADAHRMESLLWRSHIALGKMLHVQHQTQLAQREYDAASTVIDRLAATLDSDTAKQFATRAMALIPRTPRPTASQQAKAAYGGLTAREREVAALVAEGKTNREIAERLVLSERTVEKHVENAMHKLGFDTRTQVAVWAASQNLRG